MKWNAIMSLLLLYLHSNAIKERGTNLGRVFHFPYLLLIKEKPYRHSSLGT